MESSGNEGGEKKVIVALIGLVGGIVAVIGIMVANWDKIAPYFWPKPQTAISSSATPPQMNPTATATVHVERALPVEPTATATQATVQRASPAKPKRPLGFEFLVEKSAVNDSRFILQKVVLPSYATLIYFRYQNEDRISHHITFYYPGTPEAMRVIIGSRALSLKRWSNTAPLVNAYVSAKSPYLEYTVRPHGMLDILGTFEPMPEEISHFYVTEGDAGVLRNPWNFSDIEIPQN
jgi:hypothetical protein